MRLTWSPTSSVERISLQRTTILHIITAMSLVQEVAVHHRALTLDHMKQCKIILNHPLVADAKFCLIKSKLVELKSGAHN